MLELLPTALGRALRAARPGLEATSYFDQSLARVPATLILHSPVFADQGVIPSLYTADGLGISPPLVFAGVSEEAESVVLLIEDADSPTPRPLVHAIVWTPALAAREFAEGSLRQPLHRMGLNSFLRRAYLPPDPPRGHGAHRYAFQIFACAEPIKVHSAPGRGELMRLLARSALAKGLLVGTYRRA